MYFAQYMYLKQIGALTIKETLDCNNIMSLVITSIQHAFNSINE